MHADGPCPRQSNASRPARLGHRIGSVRARSIAGTADDSVKLDGHIQPHAYGSHKPSCGVRHEYIHAWLIPGLRSAATRRSQPAQQAHDSKAVDVRRAGMHEGSGARVAICAHREARERAQWSHDRLLTYIRGTARIVDRPASHASARLSLQRMLRRLSSFSLGLRSSHFLRSSGPTSCTLYFNDHESRGHRAPGNRPPLSMYGASVGRFPRRDHRGAPRVGHACMQHAQCVQWLPVLHRSLSANSSQFR